MQWDSSSPTAEGEANDMASRQKSAGAWAAGCPQELDQTQRDVSPSFFGEGHLRHRRQGSGLGEVHRHVAMSIAMSIKEGGAFF